nr:hypothetical protein [Bradyrhizobium sp. AUGA SZCCT0431]
MLSRALSLATVMLLVGCLTARAENLEAGKTPSQIFAGTCNACHKSPRGLLKNVSASSLPGFLRQHYTTSSDMAGVLASFLISNGAADTRFQSKDQPKTDAAKGAKQEAARPDQLDRFGRRQHPAATQEASRPDADGLTPQGPGRDGKRRPGQPPDAARPADGQAPQATTDSKTGAKQKLGKRGKPAEEPPKTDEAAKEDAKHETAKVDAGEKPEAAKPAGEGMSDSSKSDSSKPETGKPETGKSEAGKSEAGKPESAKSETAKVDAPRETGGSEPTPLRPDPVPPVTPAPAAAAPTPSGTSEPAAIPREPAAIPSPSAPAAAPAPATPPEVTASAPPPPPVAPAGPPAPPISE